MIVDDSTSVAQTEAHPVRWGYQRGPNSLQGRAIRDEQVWWVRCRI